MRKLILIGSISMFLTACGGAAVNSNTNSNAVSGGGQSNTNATANTTANKANTNAAANKPANTSAAKPAETGPKRISFGKGKFESTETITIAAGASAQFVIGAKNDQRLDISTPSMELTAKILKGKTSELFDMKDESERYYQSVTQGDGDIVFEVKNPTNKEIKTTLRIWLDANGG